MHNAVRLQISDRLLCGAMTVMLSRLGYTVSEDASAVITDLSDMRDAERVIYIGREEASKGRLYLRRPIDSEELKYMLALLEGERPKRKEGEVRIDKRRNLAIIDGEKIPLTEKEMRLLSLLHENAGRTVSDTEILDRVWKNETVQGSNIVAVYIKYLREKLDERVGKRLIFRVRGEGYVLKTNEKE